jgi:hypothetical protein
MMAIVRMTGQIQKEMGLLASLAHCGCQLRCGAVQGSLGAIGQLQADVVAGAEAAPAIEVSLARIVKYWHQLSHIDEA